MDSLIDAACGIDIGNRLLLEIAQSPVEFSIL
jgi:hypothetical protein